ncbi:MAG: hypothetical protein A2762_05140 [Candidatus Lloydbacteria bacterium RIFCSPHIGHO2_01_FULL_54_11]|uniref:DNA polymerase III delta N-terminal domain-containing protein n=1 Tax=Candidatus Lloydbacteria bacterium RIFCSPHIGHO2_02_FULL_50_13 TaxID=1798661 RepID=A0A1G2D1I8_9BACT|nr:MAG: hypothetical protein A2762_05140 [Candidatus Lloydbacteria bacterium RIFCSPHIGHO2_01_FULL_54_11]OGZ07322.1 MAG: hypothetical protein A3D65_00365 [Candidatus Lloydbacteria bacterium RIFCSPHIGHO2_02_FULL_50_13]OGZ14955.1 MAG: hypothetical protein A3H76_02775 [Candidatus Lloydbacteria bacterium RIFCSPLOWO2_02_FULL_54_12]
MKQRDKSIFVFLGSDGKRAREALGRVLNAEKTASPNATVTVFDDISFDSALIEEALGGVSLFGGRNVVVIDGILGNEGGEEFYLSSDTLPRSSNLVLIRETAPKKELRTRFLEWGDIEEFSLKEVSERLNNFLVADALAVKDKRLAWAEFTKLERSGASMEEVHGTIFWVVKVLFLCKTQTKDEAISAGVKEYTYWKYAPNAKRFLRSELEQKLSALKSMYHVAHEEDADLGIALEQFLLKL